MRPRPMKPFFADEAFDAKDDEVDEPTSGQNEAKADEADVAIMPTEANEAAVGLLAPSQRYSTIEGEEACQL